MANQPARGRGHVLPWLVAAALVLGASPSPAQQPAGAAAPAAAAPAGAELLSEGQVDQLTAPIALYPDPLVAQILMASTYPLEIVQAARWVKANPNVTGQALQDAMEKQPWDPSVKALTATPQVLQMMNDKLEWTQQIGDAFLAQEADVMKSVQRLRQKARQAGNLKSTDQQTVVVEPVPATTSSTTTTVIKIEPTNPQVIYVPTYTPSAVYGPWPYPSYPPYYYYPPGYVAGTALLSFGVGMAVGAAIWGNCNWGGNNVNINTNNYNSFNKTNINSGNWNHNVDHRKGVAYNNPRVNDQYRGGRGDAASRDQYRGRDGGAGAGNRGGASAGTRDLGGAGAGNRGGASAGTRDLGGAGQRGGAGPSASTRQAGAFEGMNRSGGDARAQSSRGAQSRSTMSSGGGGRSAPAARSGGGGGGGRAAGGGRGGGGRR